MSRSLKDMIQFGLGEEYRRALRLMDWKDINEVETRHIPGVRRIMLD